ncbi:TRAP transporter large permease [Pseudohoeflea coraliihabitans]|uniref:TRAP transporter large permease protein n=1 Tax=Pseudohoeflea coraliihabitans TaxID=2860393 RepID=A0ABS6WIS3_9HYPH|nr:TRAP transporter large permease subunit [Pseudohoeflea sp. DP4N28-3]MBW3095836.1 TRAP transporter large permease subunit [Pseudohoeflea sp. DP4N28-3]
MEWWMFLLAFFSGLGVLLLIGLPVALAFAAVNMVGVFYLWGGTRGLNQLILSIESSIGTFVLVPVPMFVLMGAIMFHAGIAQRMIEVLDQWIGFVAGRLAVLAIMTGALLGALTGVAMGSVAILGSTLIPEMQQRAYAKSISIGPILASGSLAILIPPSTLAIVLASLAGISVAQILVAIVVPGLLLAILYATYIILRCVLQPEIAPPYEVPHVPMRQRLKDTLFYMIPPVSIIVLVIVAIFLGIATPTEAAAVGTFLTFILAALYRRLSWKVIREGVGSATALSVMVLIILTGSAAFSQLLSFSGVTTAITNFATELPVHPLILMVLMQLVVVFLGMFLEQTSIVLVTIPIFLPIIASMGWDPIWFGTIMMLNLEMATITPPFGLSLFVMKGIVPPDYTIVDIYKAAVPFIMINLFLMGMMIAFPQIVLWLPGMM